MNAIDISECADTLLEMAVERQHLRIPITNLTRELAMKVVMSRVTVGFGHRGIVPHKGHDVTVIFGEKVCQMHCTP